MKYSHVLWVVCSALVIVQGAPKPPGETPEHGNKDIIGDIDEGLKDRPSTQRPDLSSELSQDLPENWDQTKDDQQSLFLNKSDKNDLEPYPMALADDAYDGQPIRADSQEKAPSGTLEHVIMRAELYGEPPSMGRGAQRKKRANTRPLRSDLGTTLSRVSKMAPRYSTINRFKRESNMRSEDILALLSLWEAQQRRNNEPSSYYNPNNYYNQPEPYEETPPNERDESEERWLDEPTYPISHFSRPIYPLHPSIQKTPHYSHDFPEIIPAEPEYLQNIDALRRKRQWAGFGNRNRVAKRFMVAKKRSGINFKPRDDLYTLNELLRSSQNRDQSYPVARRMIL